MKIIDGKGIVLGRLASKVAKELLKGEEIYVINCNEVLITGNKEMIQENFKNQRSRVGSGQRGPKLKKSSEGIVKKVIRGMLPTSRFGRGRDAFKRLKCYNGIPKEINLEKIIVYE